MSLDTFYTVKLLCSGKVVESFYFWYSKWLWVCVKFFNGMLTYVFWNILEHERREMGWLILELLQCISRTNCAHWQLFIERVNLYILLRNLSMTVLRTRQYPINNEQRLIRWWEVGINKVCQIKRNKKLRSCIVKKRYWVKWVHKIVKLNTKEKKVPDEYTK